jgi:uncharacterized protein
MAGSVATGLQGLLGAAVAIVVVATAAHAAAATPAGPSFDCGHAQGPVEAAICADPQLAARDAAMAQLFELVGVDALASGPSGELVAQKQWLAQRDRDCAKAAAVGDCLKGEYDARLHELAVAALIRAPDAALSELRRQSPAQAALYEAIDKMATLPDGAERTDAVAALLGPEFTKVSGSDQASMLAPIASARDAAATLGNFAHFIDLTGAVDDVAVTMPCEAIIRRSELIGALDSMFGSSMDNQLGGSDCAAMAPPPPRFAALAAMAINASMSGPDCTGTMRYAGLRYYNELLISVQLDREGTPSAPPDPAIARKSSAFQRAHHAEMSAASTDLADYYAATLHAPNAAGAQRAVGQMVDAAFEVCE